MIAMEVSKSPLFMRIQPPFDFTILVLAGAYATSVAATLDLLGAAAALAPQLKLAVPRWRVVSPAGGMLALQGGIAVATQRLPVRAPQDRSLWILPGLGLNDARAIQDRFERDDVRQAVTAVRRHVERGGHAAASCSAVFLLQRARLLHGRSATTSWWLAPTLARLQPDCRVDANRMVCTDGPIVTAGAAFAQTDLMLHLLRARFGAALTDAVSRFVLVDGRQAQAPYIVPEVMANGHELIARLTARIERSLPRALSVAELAGELRLSERTLARHVQRATGKSTLALLQSVRLQRARVLLASSRMSVDEVATQVGYQDSTALRRLMRKVAGATPSRFRPARA
jgi:transcriptional regulator GlxA family with amidase domain